MGGEPSAGEFSSMPSIIFARSSAFVPPHNKTLANTSHAARQHGARRMPRAPPPGTLYRAGMSP